MSLLPNQTRQQTPRSQNQPPKNQRRWSIDLAMQIDCVDNTLLQQIFGTPVFTYTSFISSFNLYASLMKFHVIRLIHKQFQFVPFVCEQLQFVYFIHESFQLVHFIHEPFPFVHFIHEVSVFILHEVSICTLHSWTVSIRYLSSCGRKCMLCNMHAHMCVYIYTPVEITFWWKEWGIFSEANRYLQCS